MLKCSGDNKMLPSTPKYVDIYMHAHIKETATHYNRTQEARPSHGSPQISSAICLINFNLFS